MDADPFPRGSLRGGGAASFVGFAPTPYAAACWLARLLSRDLQLDRLSAARLPASRKGNALGPGSASAGRLQSGIAGQRVAAASRMVRRQRDGISPSARTPRARRLSILDRKLCDFSCDRTKQEQWWLFVLPRCEPLLMPLRLETAPSRRPPDGHPANAAAVGASRGVAPCPTRTRCHASSSRRRPSRDRRT